MEFFIQILGFCAGIGVFLYGMRLISESLERSAGDGIRKLFDKITDNRLIGVGVGAGVTGVIQSSSATTVMVLGFVNAGLMTLFQATTVIMGANIGTTVTAILISLKSLPIGDIFAGATLVGIFMMMFAKKDRIKMFGGIICGLGLIFVGLDLMSSSMEFLRTLPQFVELFSKIKNPFLLVLIGAVFTALIQSSSATTGIVITLVVSGGGAMSLESALFVILGTNIGTCITAFMASIGAGTNAKRTALIHLAFNVIGVIIFLPILLIFSKWIVKVFGTIFGTQYASSIAWFHVIFNVSTTLLLLPFVKQLVAFVTKVIPDREGDEKVEPYHLEFLDELILSTPSIAVNQVLKEVSSMTKLAEANLDLAMNNLTTHTSKDKDAILHAEGKIDFLTKEVTNFLIKISSLHLSEKDESLIGSMYHVVTDIERIGDHAKNFLDYTEQMLEKNLTFTEDAILEISSMYDCVKEMFVLTKETFSTFKQKNLKRIVEIENQVDMMKETLAAGHINRLNEGKCNVDSGAIFFGVLVDLERVADHLNNIAFSVQPKKLLDRNQKIKEYGNDD